MSQKEWAQWQDLKAARHNLEAFFADSTNVLQQIADGKFVTYNSVAVPSGRGTTRHQKTDAFKKKIQQLERPGWHKTRAWAEFQRRCPVGAEEEIRELQIFLKERYDRVNGTLSSS